MRSFCHLCCCTGPMPAQHAYTYTWGTTIHVLSDTCRNSTKGIGNGTLIPDTNPGGHYQALQGVFFPRNQSSWSPPYDAYVSNPVTRAGDKGNTYTTGGAENCEFFPNPLDGHMHVLCAAHGVKYPGGYVPHYTLHVDAAAATTSSDAPGDAGQPAVRWRFVGFASPGGGPEATPVYEGGPPGDQARVRFCIARSKSGVSLFSVRWVQHT